MSSLLAAEWDAVVVGTGMGGGIAGRALAEAGLRVLFLERGRAGHRTESTRIDTQMADPVSRTVRGFWPDPLISEQGEFFAPLGQGVGGSSVFYAATLERPRPQDFASWPVDWPALRPLYDRAEDWLAVHGDPDPAADDPTPSLGAPAPIGAGDAAILARLRANGHRPYALHAGLRRLPGCATCLGHKCPRACKMDGRSAGVEPALATGRAALLTEAEVLAVLRDGARATGVRLRHGGTDHEVRTPRVILAAGALSTPRLLWASGAPQDGPVGRHLMLHLNEMFAVWPGVADDGPSKGVALRDLMDLGGMVQSLGVDAREGEVLHNLRQRLGATALGRTRLAQEAARVPAAVVVRALGAAKLMVGLMEDPPEPENRVLPDASGRIRVRYRVGAALEARRGPFRAGIRRAFRGLRPTFVQAAPDPNWGHACGTTRMGTDPARSVTDGRGRVHGIIGLWIADAGLFATSFGVNPSLTIAALALRVAADAAGGDG